MPGARPEITARVGMLLAALGALLLAAWGAGELIRLALQPIDVHAVREVAEERTGVLTLIARPVSFLGSAPCVVALAALACLLLAIRGRTRDALAIVLSAAGAAIIVNVVKMTVERPRPPVEHLQAATHSSFPSGHATLSSALCVAVLLLVLARRPPRRMALAAVAVTFALIAAIAASRVYLGVHYPTDVIAGSLAGAVWSVFVAWLLRPHRRAPAGTARRQPSIAARPSGSE